MSDLGDLLGAPAVLLFIGVRWVWQNWRFLLPIALGLWGLFLLSELRRGFEHVSAQLAAVDARLAALQDAAGQRNDRLQEVSDLLHEVKNHLLEIEQDVSNIDTLAQLHGK